jgi:hypothetical protein
MARTRFDRLLMSHDPGSAAEPFLRLEGVGVAYGSRVALQPLDPLIRRVAGGGGRVRPGSISSVPG